MLASEGRSEAAFRAAESREWSCSLQVLRHLRILVVAKPHANADGHERDMGPAGLQQQITTLKGEKTSGALLHEARHV